MKQFLFTLIMICVLTAPAMGQYTMSGKIEYEKKVNQHAQLKDFENESWVERVRSSTPKFNITYFDLLFDTARCIYKPGKEVETKNTMFGGDPAADNTVLTDLNKKKVRAVKNVFEQKFMVQDSMRKMDWRIKDEIRTIANYKCRKAVGRILDSVYVVAFFAEDIIASGGPELFGGLPGMILELAIPRLHTTWVATKVEVMVPQDADFVIPEKGKKVTQKELNETIQSSLKDWGKWAARNIWWVSL